MTFVEYRICYIMHSACHACHHYFILVDSCCSIRVQETSLCTELSCAQDWVPYVPHMAESPGLSGFPCLFLCNNIFNDAKCWFLHVHFYPYQPVSWGTDSMQFSTRFKHTYFLIKVTLQLIEKGSMSKQSNINASWQNKLINQHWLSHYTASPISQLNQCDQSQ